MKSSFYHIQVNVNAINIPFYKKLFNFLGWSVIMDEEDAVGFKSGTNGDMWFYTGGKNEQTDYDKLGMNHVAIRVEEQKDIDALTTFLKEQGTEPKFETPRHRAEFSPGPNETYYQVMFVSPDNILFEVVYIGAK